jgi:hypothetical protein
MVKVVRRHLFSPTPNVQSRAASCLLQCLTTASSETLRAAYPGLLTDISQLLTSVELLGVVASRSVSKTRRVSAYLRLLQAILSRLRPLPYDLVQSAVDIFSRWLYHGLGFTAASRSALPDRSKLGSSGALGFGLVGSSSTAGRAQRSRSNSTKSNYVTSESEDEVGQNDTLYVIVCTITSVAHCVTYRSDARARVRLDAVSCLEAIAQVCLVSAHSNPSILLNYTSRQTRKHCENIGSTSSPGLPSCGQNLLFSI